MTEPCRLETERATLATAALQHGREGLRCEGSARTKRQASEGGSVRRRRRSSD